MHGWLAALTALTTAFTEDSLISHKVTINRKGHPSDRDVGTMALFKRLRRLARATKEFVAPSYHPEIYYMRGPGPACARKSGHGALPAG